MKKITLTRRGERVAVAAGLAGFLLAMGLVGGIETGSIPVGAQPEKSCVTDAECIEMFGGDGYGPAELENDPVGYFEIAEDGSADHYYVENGETIRDQSWPAGTYPATGQWTLCRPGVEWSQLCDTVLP